MSSDDLFTAARNGNLSEVDRILSIPDGKAPDPDEKDKLGRTAMHLAAWAGHALVVKWVKLSYSCESMHSFADIHVYRMKKIENSYSFFRSMLAGDWWKLAQM
jgi:hypothetical protein